MSLIYFVSFLLFKWFVRTKLIYYDLSIRIGLFVVVVISYANVIEFTSEGFNILLLCCGEVGGRRVGFVYLRSLLILSEFFVWNIIQYWLRYGVYRSMIEGILFRR